MWGMQGNFMPKRKMKGVNINFSWELLVWGREVPTVKLCILLVRCHPSGWLFSLEKNSSRWLQAHNFTTILSHECPFKHVDWSPGGVICQVLQCSPFPTDTDAVFNSFSNQSCLHITCSLSPYLCPVGCFREILFKQTNKELSLEPVGFFRHICFLGAWKYLTLYQYRQWNSGKLCIFLVGCHPSASHLAS